MSINEEVKELRIKKKLSQPELSKLSGVTTQQIYRFENDLQKLSHDKVVALLNALGKDFKIVNKK